MGVGRCGGEEEDEYDPSNRGPNSKRGCTDVPCLLLLIAFIGGWIGVGAYSFTFGNPAQLIYPSNSEGEICGRGQHTDRPVLLFFDLTRCARISTALTGCPTPQVCVAACPNELWNYKMDKAAAEPFCRGLDPGEFQATNYNTLVKRRKCPAYLLPSQPVLGRCIPSGFGSKPTASALVQEAHWHDGSISAEAKAPTAQPTTPSVEEITGMDRTDLKDGWEYLVKSLNLKDFGAKILADLALDWWVLVIALLLACVFSFLWIFLIRLAAGVIVWTTIVLCCLLLLAITGFSFYQYFITREKEVAGFDDIFLRPGFETIVNQYFDQNTWLTVGIVMGVVTLIIILVLLFLIKRIQIAVELIEEASKAVGQAMTTLIFPVVPFLFQTLVLVWFLMVASCLATAGEKEYKVVDCPLPETSANSSIENGDICDPETFLASDSCPQGDKAQCVFHKFGPNALHSWLQVLNLAGLFWLLFFLGAMGEMMMAGAFSEWYWTRPEDKKNHAHGSSLGASMRRTLRYHLGTLAFGSLILTVIRMIRVVLEWVEERLRRWNLEDNPVVKVFMCCCKCCMWCLEKFIRYMNRNAYIMTAIYGYNFCNAGRKSFTLIMSNAVRAGTLDRVTDFILFLGKIIVVTLVTVISYFSLDNFKLINAELNQVTGTDLSADLNYKCLPLIMIAIGTYAIASCFFSVYSMAVDTIFLCFLEDLDRHRGGPYFMSGDLKKILRLKEFKKPKEEIPLTETTN